MLALDPAYLSQPALVASTTTQCQDQGEDLCFESTQNKAATTTQCQDHGEDFWPSASSHPEQCRHEQGQPGLAQDAWPGQESLTGTGASASACGASASTANHFQSAPHVSGGGTSATSEVTNPSVTPNASAALCPRGTGLCSESEPWPGLPVEASSPSPVVPGQGPPAPSTRHTAPAPSISDAASPAVGTRDATSQPPPVNDNVSKEGAWEASPSHALEASFQGLSCGSAPSTPSETPPGWLPAPSGSAEQSPPEIDLSHVLLRRRISASCPSSPATSPSATSAQPGKYRSKAPGPVSVPRRSREAAIANARGNGGAMATRRLSPLPAHLTHSNPGSPNLGLGTPPRPPQDRWAFRVSNRRSQGSAGEALQGSVSTSSVAECPAHAAAVPGSPLQPSIGSIAVTGWSPRPTACGPLNTSPRRDPFPAALAVAAADCGKISCSEQRISRAGSRGSHAPGGRVKVPATVTVASAVPLKSCLRKPGAGEKKQVHFAPTVEVRRFRCHSTKI